MATSQALLSKASGLLLLLCAGVCLPLRRAQQSGDRAQLVATAVLCLALAKAKQLLASVVLLGHVVDGDHMRADAHVLEALAAADEAAGVGLALR